MPFPDQIRIEVRKKSAFRCCRCHEIGIDVHHIIPQCEGGSDDIENAAPLCQNCHDRFGDSAQKRKEIAQMRDWWYSVVEEKYGTGKQYKKDLAQLSRT
jgi:5-methylcytosine-specific restriction endonuclease McrA